MTPSCVKVLATLKSGGGGGGREQREWIQLRELGPFVLQARAQRGSINHPVSLSISEEPKIQVKSGVNIVFFPPIFSNFQYEPLSFCGYTQEQPAGSARFPYS